MEGSCGDARVSWRALQAEKMEEEPFLAHRLWTLQVVLGGILLVVGQRQPRFKKEQKYGWVVVLAECHMTETSNDQIVFPAFSQRTWWIM